MWEPEKNCYYCICRVCAAIKCPHSYYRNFPMTNTLSPRCFRCTRDDNVHLFNCDYFRHRGNPVFKVIRRHRKRDEIIERLERIEALLNDKRNDDDL